MFKIEDLDFVIVFHPFHKSHCLQVISCRDTIFSLILTLKVISSKSVYLSPIKVIQISLSNHLVFRFHMYFNFLIRSLLHIDNSISPLAFLFLLNGWFVDPFNLTVSLVFGFVTQLIRQLVVIYLRKLVNSQFVESRGYKVIVLLSILRIRRKFLPYKILWSVLRYLFFVCQLFL